MKRSQTASRVIASAHPPWLTAYQSIATAWATISTASRPPVRGDRGQIQLTSGLLVGGAILGVVVATASQASLGNFFAGLLLMLGRPYRVGSAVRLRGPERGR